MSLSFISSPTQPLGKGLELSPTNHKKNSLFVCSAFVKKNRAVFLVSESEEKGLKQPHLLRPRLPVAAAGEAFA